MAGPSPLLPQGGTRQVRLPEVVEVNFALRAIELVPPSYSFSEKQTSLPNLIPNLVQNPVENSIPATQIGNTLPLSDIHSQAGVAGTNNVAQT